MSEHAKTNIGLVLELAAQWLEDVESSPAWNKPTKERARKAAKRIRRMLRTPLFEELLP